MTSIRDVIEMTKAGAAASGLWYLATPYAKYPMGKDTAATHAAKIAATLIKNDVAVFCPIAHGHLINLNGGPADRHDVWLPLDEKFMQFCVGVIVARMPGYHYSTGVRYEIEWFTKAKRPIIYMDVIDFLDLPPLFNDQALSDEAEAKLMNEAQPYAIGVDPAKPGSDCTVHWYRAAMRGKGFDDLLDEAFQPSPDLGDALAYTFAAKDQCNDAPLPNPDPREAHGYRKDRPVATGVMDYFPLALAEVARISVLGNAQHNTGDQHLHWERTKSNDHADCIARHLADRGGYGLDGAAHSANMAWRALATVQEEQEDQLLEAGVHPAVVFSRASTFYGKSAREYFAPVIVDWRGHTPSRRDWLDAAENYWGNPAAEQADRDFMSGTEWNSQDVAEAQRREQNAAAAYAAKIGADYVPPYSKDTPEFKAGYVAGLHDKALEPQSGAFTADLLTQAAESLRNMVHEWYAFAARTDYGIEPPRISADIITRRLKRFL